MLLYLWRSAGRHRRVPCTQGQHLVSGCMCWWGWHSSYLWGESTTNSPRLSLMPTGDSVIFWSRLVLTAKPTSWRRREPSGSPYRRIYTHAQTHTHTHTHTYMHTHKHMHTPHTHEHTYCSWDWPRAQWYMCVQYVCVCVCVCVFVCLYFNLETTLFPCRSSSQQYTRPEQRERGQAANEIEGCITNACCVQWGDGVLDGIG